MRRSVVLDFGPSPVHCAGICPRMSPLEALSADSKEDRAREALGVRSRAPDIQRRGLDSRSRSMRGVGSPDSGTRAVPQDLAGTASAAPGSAPESSPRGPRLETAGPVGPGSRPVDYAEQLQNRWLEIASQMPQIVEDTYLMGGLPIYRPAGGDKHVGLVLRPNAPLGLALGVKFH
ncbi:MAG: hypothetical protein HUU21_08400 [Polyangiaceae bacterium]|nr:hypothetical protein [Polyangiaceae bacterium]